MNKRIIALLMAGAMVGSMTGCAPKKAEVPGAPVTQGQETSGSETGEASAPSEKGVTITSACGNGFQQRVCRLIPS